MRYFSSSEEFDVVVGNIIQLVLLIRLEIVVNLGKDLKNFLRTFGGVAVIEETSVDNVFRCAGFDQCQCLLPETFLVCPFDKVDEYYLITFNK